MHTVRGTLRNFLMCLFTERIGIGARRTYFHVNAFKSILEPLKKQHNVHVEHRSFWVQSTKVFGHRNRYLVLLTVIKFLFLFKLLLNAQKEHSTLEN